MVNQLVFCSGGLEGTRFVNDLLAALVAKGVVIPDLVLNLWFVIVARDAIENDPQLRIFPKSTEIGEEFVHENDAALGEAVWSDG